MLNVGVIVKYKKQHVVSIVRDNARIVNMIIYFIQKKHKVVHCCYLYTMVTSYMHYT